MDKAITVTLLALGIALGVGPAAAQDTGISESTDQTTDVNVTVSNITKLDVRPTSLDYSDLNPGALQNESDNGFKQVEIENIGSTDIEEISAETTMPGSNPFGTGTSSSYDSGNFVKLKTETASNGDYNSQIDSESNFHFINRVEYAEDPAPTYIQTKSDSEITSLLSSTTNVSRDVGRFRKGQEQYFYVIYYDEASGCTGQSDSRLWVGTNPHTVNTLGTYDFTDSSAADISANPIVNTGGSGDYYGEVENVGLGSQTYDVFTRCGGGDEDGNKSDHHTVRTRWNVDVETPVTGDSTSATSESVGGANAYLIGEVSESNSLRPGSSFPVDLAVEVPLGVAEGEVQEGTLTILAKEEA
jgi:hypothetical protein